MTDTAEEAETITFPADPEALGRAIVERYDVYDLNTIVRPLDEALQAHVREMLEMVLEDHKNTPPPPAPDPDDFSELQREIVVHIWKQDERLSEEIAALPPDDWYRGHLERRGVRWDPNTLDGDLTPSKRVSISRALRRLQHRGIVSRENDTGRGGNRTTRVELTDIGRLLAARLTS